MKGAIFLTGATGFLGMYAARWILNNTDHDVFLLVRANTEAEALRRLSRGWHDVPELIGAPGHRIRAVRGDITEPGLGLSPEAHDDLVSTLSHIIHMAADVRIDSPLEKLRLINVKGTEHVLELAREVHRDHGLTRFSHISTAYVAGGRKGDVPEDALTGEYGFSNSYELSKYESECIVREAAKTLPVSVFRPGMIVGDSRTGAIRTFNTLYLPLRLYMTERLSVFPLSRSLRINLVPVDYVADAVTRLTFDPRAENKTFHLTAPSGSLPMAGELLDFVRDWARTHLGVTLRRPRFLPVPFSVIQRLFSIRKIFGFRRGSILNTLPLLAPYFSERGRYLRDNTDRLLGQYNLDWRDFMPNLLDYSARMNFMHRTERTVHEQIVFRMSSRRLPVTCHDVTKHGSIARDTAELRRDILKAASAFRSMNVQPGDRVAIAGFNSTRFFTIDTAIGLAGAVSVPLYYTSPPAEIERIVRHSGSQLLFLGSPALLEKTADMALSIPVISFCREIAPVTLPSRVISWDDFLSKGARDAEAQPVSPVSFDDIATLRYTSGTTGNPKGVVFKHAHLRWMAETLASLIPWKSRNAAISYVSFLPLNHVVEGILGLYSPYYTPAPLNIYFLEDFHDLSRTLPKVRPTIFFSVPRFYEKVLETIAKSRALCLFVRMPDGFMKNMMRPFLRRIILKKTGLDRCAQLIVGSAPAGEFLFTSFRAFGIEIHNAYGLTETPLVTLNRHGANRPGTVGEPLPETQLAFSDDGEVMVKGPHVTSGYYGDGAGQPFRDGWLLTGDTGYLDNEGRLVLNGRKSELMVTSWGKNIFPVKIEMLFRELPSVSEVMLIGDNRPYCIALLWVAETLCEGISYDVIDDAVMRVNARLSHPEQVKRWCILRDDLSIEGGFRTANLKIRRKVVEERYHEVIDSLYNNSRIPPYVLHAGYADRDTAQ